MPLDSTCVSLYTVLLWFSYGSLMVLLWFSYGSLMVLLWFSYGSLMVLLFPCTGQGTRWRLRVQHLSGRRKQLLRKLWVLPGQQRRLRSFPSRCVYGTQCVACRPHVSAQAYNCGHATLCPTQLEAIQREVAASASANEQRVLELKQLTQQIAELKAAVDQG